MTWATETDTGLMNSHLLYLSTTCADDPSISLLFYFGVSVPPFDCFPPMTISTPSAIPQCRLTKYKTVTYCFSTSLCSNKVCKLCHCLANSRIQCEALFPQSASIPPTSIPFSWQTWWLIQLFLFIRTIYAVMLRYADYSFIVNFMEIKSLSH